MRLLTDKFYIIKFDRERKHSFPFPLRFLNYNSFQIIFPLVIISLIDYHLNLQRHFIQLLLVFQLTFPLLQLTFLLGHFIFPLVHFIGYLIFLLVRLFILILLLTYFLFFPIQLCKALLIEEQNGRCKIQQVIQFKYCYHW